MEEENNRGARARRSRHLPEELQEKILIRLPVKSLQRFELVCKTWQSMFHSRPFIDSYGIRRRSRVFYTAPELRKMAPGMRKSCFTFNNDPEVCWRIVDRLVGPLSNGVYCLASHLHEERGDYSSIFAVRIALCSPSSGHDKATNCLPIPTKLRLLLRNKINHSYLGRVSFGFGKINSSSSSSSDWDYKVVVLISHGKPASSFISLVYNHQSREWKIILEYERGMTMVGDRKATEAFDMQGRRIIEICIPLELRPQRLLKGRWHWIAIGEDRSFNVLSFDFADEEFRLMGSAPADFVTNESCSVKAVVSVLHDRLVVIYLLYSELSHCVEVDVWMMMEYGVEESWMKMCKINPNLDGDQFERHLGIEYSTQRDEERGCVRIKSLSFSDFDNQQIDLLL